MTQINAQIVAHSVNPQGDEIISILATFPRIILAEVNTHRMLSKNTSSSRAIPFNKMVETIKKDPFIPIAWQKHHSGMQGTEYMDDLDSEIAIREWKYSIEESINAAKQLSEVGITKQLCNRLLEPFMWTTMLITGPKSGWENFFNLRCPSYKYEGQHSKSNPAIQARIYKSKKDWLEEYKWNYSDDPPQIEKPKTELDWLKLNKGQAEIHMMALAECIYDAVKESTAKQLKAGEWHIPFRDKMFDTFNIKPRCKTVDVKSEEFKNFIPPFVKVSVAMAARTSYTVVGEEKELDYEALLGLHDRLLAQDPPHSSPLEHCAKAMSAQERNSFIKGSIYMIDVEDPQYNGGIYEPDDSEKGWCNNLKGFIPYRYLVDNKKI